MIPASLGTAITVAFGPVLAADGTMSNGALAYTDFKIWKNGSVGALDASAVATHKFEGVYELALTANDISAVGVATVTLNKNPLSASRVVITVLPVATYETLMTLTQTTPGYVVAAVKKLFDVATPVLTAESVNQTIDNPTAAAIGTDAAGKVLVTPAQKLATDANGKVTFANTSIATVTNAVTTTVTPDAAGTLGALVGAKGGLPKLDATTGLKVVGYGGGDVTVPVVTTLTNLPSAPTDWLAAAAVKADAVTKIQAGVALEATLTGMKGAGWSTETLKEIKSAIDGRWSFQEG